MRKLFLLIALFGVLAVGCEELFPTEQTPNAIPIFETDSESSYIVSADGEEITILVTTNIDYSVVIPKDAEDWLSVVCTRSDTHEEILSFVVAPNEDFEERTTKAELVDGNGEVIETISFIQEGQSKIFDINSEDFYIFEPEGSSVTIDVTTNLEYSVVIDKNVQSWLSVADTRATLREETLTFTAAPNDTDNIRYAFVELIDADNNVLQEIPFIQNAITQSDSSCPNDEIWYTNGSTTEATTPYATDVFGANIVSNTYDAEKECWIITFDGEVTTMGDYAFYRCLSLTSVTIPDSVTTIGDIAFYGCENLQKFNSKYASEDGRCLIIEGALYAFAPAGLTEYTIPNSATAIEDSAFNGCGNLTSITISDSVISIGNGAFNGCHSLKQFKGKFASEDGRCLIINGALNSFAPANITEYNIPKTVTSIGNYAFYNCYNLTSVTIPDSVTKIGRSAFDFCSSLTNVYCKAITPPAGGSYMFYGNASDRKIYVPAESVEAYKNAEYWSEYADDIVGYNFETGEVTPSNTIPSNEIWYTNGSTTEATTPYATDVFGANIVSNTYNTEKECWVIKFDGKVTTIGDYAFYYCYSLTSVTIPDSVTEIGDFAFYECSSLTSVTIPDSVTEIGDFAFYECSSLTSVTIGDSVTTIGNYAFEYCSSLTSVTIPDSVTEIGYEAFCSCDNLQKFNSKYASEDGRCLIIDGVLNYFAIGCGATEYTIPDSVTTIGKWAFAYCNSLTSVTIPDSVTAIGDSAFRGCSSLTSVYCRAITPPAVGSYMFFVNATGRKIYVPMESAEAYKSASGWSEYAEDIVGYNF